MTLPAAVVEFLQAGGHGEVLGTSPVGGGCIHNAQRLSTTTGATFFLKRNSQVPADMFSAEAEGLRAVISGCGPRLPQPLLWGIDFLLLEDLGGASAGPGFWERLGRELAGLHANRSPRFGFKADNYIGLTPQPNPWEDDGVRFFAEHRLRFQGRRAETSGLLGRSDLKDLESLCEGLQGLVPLQDACLIHGDLWSGNVMAGPGGEPCLVDPACHYGWAEAELGMTRLFGGFPEAFYAAYQEVHPLQPGWRERLPIYNLYHLLNHLNLFGSGYLPQVRSVLRRFA